MSQRLTLPRSRFLWGRILLPVLIASGLAWAGEVVAPPSTPPGPTAPSPDAQVAESERLAKQLPQRTWLAVRADGKLYWQVDGDLKSTAYPIKELDNGGNPRLDTGIGALTVDRRLVAGDSSIAALTLLPRLIEHAVAAGLKADELMFLEGLVTGPHLSSSTHRVLPEGCLAKTAAPARPAGEREALIAAAKKVATALAGSDLDTLGRRTLEEVLDRLGQNDVASAEADEFTPSFARRIMRHGWLRRVLPKSEADEQLELAMIAAEQLLPVTQFLGKDAQGRNLRLAEVKNGFGLGGWILQTPERACYLRPVPRPVFYEALPESGLNLVVQLAPGADPLAGRPEPVAARLVSGNQVIAAWRSGKPLEAALDSWRRVVPVRGRGIANDAVAEVMPPHLALVALNGDLLALVVGKDVLRPPRDGSDGESARFLTDAARVLPDAPSLDLIGEYLFQYVHDSPDSRYPQLIGNKSVKGDIHQTAAQTIATNAGGQFRGDCDDLAELYQTIAERQGRTAHVLSLPGHAAVAWADRKEDGRWHVYLMQTGPTLEFIATTLPEALEKTYKRFDVTETFDPNSLGLLLRFSGENTRSSWRLSWRIFSDADYARTMIDVQRDWHFQTYARGISKMEAMFAKGDKDNANARELAGLATHTGQFDKAVRWTVEALANTPQPLSKFYLRQELLGHLFDASAQDPSKRAEAESLAKELLDQQIPQLKKQLGPSLVQVGLQLTGTLAHYKSQALAVRALDQCLQSATYTLIPGRDPQTLPSLAEDLSRFAIQVKDADGQRAWREDQRLNRLRRILTMYAATATEVLAGSPRGAITGDAVLQDAARLVQLWLNDLAFSDVDEPGEIMFRYAQAARYYAAVLGEKDFGALLNAAVPPPIPAVATAPGVAPAPGTAPAPAPGHGKRIGGLAQLPLDLPWIRISLPYWFGRLAEQFAKDHPSVDVEAVQRLGRSCADAWAAAQARGLEHPRLQHEAHLAAVITSLVNRDADALRKCLQFVKAKGDKRLRDDTAQWLGDCARALPLDWYGQVIDLWCEVLHDRQNPDAGFDKAKWFWIAWRAWLSGAHDHALLVADRAAKEFPGDPAFAEEAKFMRAQARPKKP